MSVTIRDVNTNEEIIIPPEGLIFGRTGGDADIQLDDNSISRRQARVSLKGGNWLVETIAVAQGQRPPRPVTLVEGQTFIVGQNEFEVVSIAESDQEEEVSPPPKPAARPAAKPASRAPTMKTAPAAAPSKRPAAAPAKRAAPAGADDDGGGDEGGDAIPSKGFGAMFVAVPKGLAYYLLAVPKMLFNPLGTVRTAIEEQPAEPMGKIELIGYALPAQMATALLGSIAAGLALLIGPGHVFSLMSFIPIVPAIIAVVSAIIVGFIFHPVMEWLIRFLKGESDARSRTNYFLQLMTLSIVLAVPNALGLILGSLPIPFINLVGPLLMTVASLVSIYVAYQWFVSFGVVKWFRTVLLVLGAASVLFAALGFVMGVVHTIQGFGHSSSSTVADTGNAEADEAIAKAMAEAEKAAEGNPEMKKVLEEQKAAIAAAKKNGAAAAAASEEGEKAEKAAEKATEKAEKAGKPEKTAKKEEAAPAADPEPTVAEEAPPAVKAIEKASSGGKYGSYSRKREAIEAVLTADPTLLEGNQGLQDQYGEYLKDSSEIEKKFQKEIAKNSNKARLYEHLRDAELYKTTGKQVNDLAAKLKIH